MRSRNDSQIMAYYRLDVMKDASPVGLGGVLQQKQDEGQYKSVYYVSRKLPDPKTRYSV